VTVILFIVLFALTFGVVWRGLADRGEDSLFWKLSLSTVTGLAIGLSLALWAHYIFLL
jgi:hypothetical protein